MNEIFKALADDNRLRIINILRDLSLCVCDIENALDLIQTNVSRNLKILKDANIVKSEKKAQWQYYSLTDEFKEHIYLFKQLEQLFSEDKYLQDINERDAYINKCSEEVCC